MGAQYADTAAIADSTVTLAQNWDRLTPQQQLASIGQLGFWGMSTAVSARQAGGFENLYGAKSIRETFGRRTEGQKAQGQEIPDDFLLGDRETLNPKYDSRVRETIPSLENLRYKSIDENPQQMADYERYFENRREVLGRGVTDGQINARQRKDIREGKKALSFAEVDIPGLPKKLDGISFAKTLETRDGQPSFDSYPPYVDQNDRQLKALKFNDSKLMPAADGEAKMAEYIFRNTSPDTKGNIHIVTDRPACSSCYHSLYNLAKQRPGLKIEVIETPRK
jgi:hypothetical protein